MGKNKNALDQLFFFNAKQEIISKTGLPWNLLCLFSEVSVSTKGFFFSNLIESAFLCLPAVIVKNKERKTEKETNNQWCILSSV